MDWDEVKQMKRKINSEVHESLSDEEVTVLRWLVDYERKHRFVSPQSSRVPSKLQRQIEQVVRPGEGESPGKEDVQ